MLSETETGRGAVLGIIPGGSHARLRPHPPSWDSKRAHPGSTPPAGIDRDAAPFPNARKPEFGMPQCATGELWACVSWRLPPLLSAKGLSPAYQRFQREVEAWGAARTRPGTRHVRILQLGGSDTRAL